MRHINVLKIYNYGGWAQSRFSKSLICVGTFLRIIFLKSLNTVFLIQPPYVAALTPMQKTPIIKRCKDALSAPNLCLKYLFSEFSQKLPIFHLGIQNFNYTLLRLVNFSLTLNRLGGGGLGSLSAPCSFVVLALSFLTRSLWNSNLKDFLLKYFIFYLLGRVQGRKKSILKKKSKITHNFFVTKTTNIKIIFLKSPWKMDDDTSVTLWYLFKRKPNFSFTFLEPFLAFFQPTLAPKLLKLSV